MPGTSVLPSPRRLLELGPHAAGHRPALRVAAGLAVPLVVLTALGRVDLSLYAVFGSFAAVYGRTEGLRPRLRSQLTSGVALVAAVGLGSLVSTAGPARAPLAVAAAALVATAGSVVGEVLRWRPAGSMFLVFATGATSSVVPAAGTPTAAHVGTAHVGTALAVAAASAVLAVLLGALTALGDRAAAAAPLRVRATLAHRGVWVRAARYLVAAAAGGAVATAAGLGHPYWACVTAVVPMAAPDTQARLLRAGHRLVGTAAGLLVAAALLALHPSGWALVALVALAQFGAELFVLRNYSVAMLFITPLALLMNAAAGQVDPGRLLADRAVETALGVLVGVAVTLLWAERPRPAPAGG